MKYRNLTPLERIEAGDEFTWSSDYVLTHPGEEREWYPVETFIGQRVEKLQRRSNVIFRRVVADATAASATEAPDVGEN